MNCGSKIFVFSLFYVEFFHEPLIKLTYVTHSGVVDFLFDKLLSATVFHLLAKLEWILNLAPKFNKVYWEASQVNTHLKKGIGKPFPDFFQI